MLHLKQNAELNEAFANGATFIENVQAYQIPQYQIFTPFYQRAPNPQLTSQSSNGNEDLVNLIFVK